MFTQGSVNADVLNGGAGDDTLYGNGGNDKLSGNAGNDILAGGAGDDSLAGGAGEDYLIGGAGNDTLDGGADADWASYEDATAAVKVDLNLTTAQNTLGSGTDTLRNIENLYGSAFNDTLIGNNGANYLHGGAGNDSLFGGNGDDHFEGGAGNDTLNGGAGDDIVSYEDGLAGGVSIDLNLTTGQTSGAHGTDTLISIEAVWGSAYDDKLTGNAADNYLYGGAGNDALSGGAGADGLDGADGNDTIIGGQGADDLTGGAGNDLFKFAAGDSGVFSATGVMTAGTADVIADFQTGDRLDFGLTVGTSSNYTENTAANLTAAQTAANGAFAANYSLLYVATQVGADVQLFASDAGGGEAHSLVTLKGVSTAAIGFNNIAGSAVVVTPPVGQIFAGSAASESLIGGAGPDTLIGGPGDDTLTGGAGDDLFKFAAGDSIVSPSTPTALALAGDVILDFQGGSRGTGTENGTGDTLTFGMVQGMSANYIENSASTLDAAVAQANAAFASSSGLRYVATQVGADVKLFASDPDGGELHSVVTLKGGAISAIGFSNIAGTGPAITGTAGPDDLVGTLGADLIQGLGGNDTIHSNDGDDTLLGGDGNDVFLLGSQAGLKTINGDAGIDTLDASGSYSSTGRLVLDLNNTTTIQDSVFEQHIRIIISNVENVVGGAGDDGINGDNNANRLSGGAGNDNLSGNGGDDTLNGGLGNDTLVGSAGNNLYVFATGDSGGFDATGDWKGGDVILGFGIGGADSLDFGLVRGTVVNYTENSAQSSTAAVLRADAMFHADTNLRYVATQVGADVQLIVSDVDGGEAHGLVMLVGMNTSTFGFGSIVGAPPITDPNLVSGTDAADSLVGTATSDRLYGGDGADTLNGGAGADTVFGGNGPDVLTGGSGADRFALAAGDSGMFIAGAVTFGTADTITDFETGVDVLSFGLGAGSTGNYVQASPIYLTYADAEAAARSLFLGQPSASYVVTQVGNSSYLFVDSSGDHSADSVLFLQGVALNGVAATDIV